jgi:hypothetical protein
MPTHLRLQEPDPDGGLEATDDSSSSVADGAGALPSGSAPDADTPTDFDSPEWRPYIEKARRMIAASRAPIGITRESNAYAAAGQTFGPCLFKNPVTGQIDGRRDVTPRSKRTPPVSSGEDHPAYPASRDDTAEDALALLEGTAAKARIDALIAAGAVGSGHDDDGGVRSRMNWRKPKGAYRKAEADADKAFGGWMKGRGVPGIVQRERPVVNGVRGYIASMDEVFERDDGEGGIEEYSLHDITPDPNAVDPPDAIIEVEDVAEYDRQALAIRVAIARIDANEALTAFDLRVRRARFTLMLEELGLTECERPGCHVHLNPQALFVSNTGFVAEPVYWMEPKGGGRPSVYCSESCKQKAKRARTTS